MLLNRPDLAARSRAPGPLLRNLALALALAAAGAAGTARAEPVYFGAAARGLERETTTSFRAALERSLVKQGVKVLDTSSAVEDTTQKARDDARAALEEAAASFKDEEYTAALSFTGKALEAFELGPAFTEAKESWALYRDVLSLRALILLKAKKKRDADAALRQLLIVLPKYAPNRERAPVELIRHVEDVKDELRSLPPAVLEIKSKPSGAKVLVDGKKRGKTPLELNDIVPGIHYVAIEGISGKYTERVVVSESGENKINAKLGSRKGAAARDAIREIERPQGEKAFVDAISDVDDDAIVAVLLPAGKKVEVIAARVTDGEIKVVCGVRVEDNENDRERATYVLVEGLLERKKDAWLDEAKEDDPDSLREKLFVGMGSDDDSSGGEPMSPAVIALGVVGGVVVLVAAATGVGVLVSRELKKNDGFTWSVDTSGL